MHAFFTPFRNRERYGRARLIMACLALIGAIAGCHSGPSATQAPRVAPRTASSLHPVRAQANSMPIESLERCPDRVQNTRVVAEKLERGAALVFTRSDDTGELRRRVADTSSTLALPSAPARFDNIAHGVRVVFELEDGAHGSDVSAVQRRIESRARRIADECGYVLAGPPEPKVSKTLPPIEHREPKTAQKPSGDVKKTGKAETDPKKKASPDKPAVLKTKPKDLKPIPSSTDPPKSTQKPNEKRKPVLPKSVSFGSFR